MTRSVPEWIGAAPDAKVPPRVRLRIFERHNGVCHIARRKINAGEPWDCDHIVALCNGGEHRELNLAPALRDKHREKTREDVAEKAETYRKRSKHLGLKPARQKLQSRGFSRVEPQRTASRPIERRT
jgi:5-methylcytosine-specific restriction enzyme A